MLMFSRDISSDPEAEEVVSMSGKMPLISRPCRSPVEVRFGQVEHNSDDELYDEWGV